MRAIGLVMVAVSNIAMIPNAMQPVRTLGLV